MEQEKRNQMIIEHWIRVILRGDFIIDLILMIVEFSKFHEKFDLKLSHDDLYIENDGLIARSLVDTDYKWRTVIGIFVAESGGKYTWRVKLIQGRYICCGVLKNSAIIKENVEQYWWGLGAKQGTAFYTKGFIEPGTVRYGDQCQEDDTITMCLDLNKCEISYKVNDKELGPAPMKGFVINSSDKYRLGIGFYGGNAPNAVEILSLDIES